MHITLFTIALFVFTVSWLKISAFLMLSGSSTVTKKRCIDKFIIALVAIVCFDHSIVLPSKLLYLSKI